MIVSCISVADVVHLLEGTEGDGKALWRDFVPYLRRNMDLGKFALIEPCVTGPPSAVPQHVYYYPQGHAALDGFLTGYCRPCQKAGAKSHPWCSKHHELLDYHSVWAAGINVARDVDTGKDDYNGVIRYRATASGVADMPPPDRIVNQVRQCQFANDWCRLSVSVVHRSEWYPYSLGRARLRPRMQELLILLLPYSLTCRGTQNPTSFLISH